jgi:hypothetical protein
MEDKRRTLEDYANAQLSLEKDLVRRDVERAERDRQNRFSRKLNMAASLRESLLKQQSEKRVKEIFEREQNN